MNPVGRAVYKAFVEGKWLDITYFNKNKVKTRYWIAIKDIVPLKKLLVVEGFNYSIAPEPTELLVYFDSIQAAKVIEGTYYPRNEKLYEDMKLHPQNYAFLTLSPLNINILDYYAECHRLDNQPYIKENTFVRRVDDAELRKKGYYELSESQFQELVSFFRKELGQDRAFRKTLEFALNQLAINTEKGLYVLAYRRLFLGIKN